VNIKLWKPTLEEILKYFQGLEGEALIRDFLKSKRILHFQVDLIFLKDGKYFLAEVKNQEPYLPPPFEGHGLPEWQIKARLDFADATGVEPWLFVCDPIHKQIYCRGLRELNNGEHFDTNGDRPRRIFPLSCFHTLLKEGITAHA
jgi:hypothetical protein